MAKLIERRKRLQFTPFPYQLDIIVSNDVPASYVKQAKKYGLKELGANKVALTLSTCGNGTMLLDKNADLESIAHEVIHVVLFFMEHIGAEHEHEFMAYYSGWLTQEITRFVLKKGKHVK